MQSHQSPNQRNTPEQQTAVEDQDLRGLTSLAPIFLIRRVIDDWFEFVHPVAPILHRETFVRQLEIIARHDDEFICLAISICAATVTTLRRKSLEYDSTITVDKCYEMICHIDRDHTSPRVNLTRCQTKYNMAVALGSENGMDNIDSQVLIAEATAMIARIIHYEMHAFSLRDRELAKRLYWLCFAAQW